MGSLMKENEKDKVPEELRANVHGCSMTGVVAGIFPADLVSVSNANEDLVPIQAKSLESGSIGDRKDDVACLEGTPPHNNVSDARTVTSKERQLVLSAGLFDDQVSLSSSRQGVVWKSGCGVNNPNRESDVESDSATLFECDDDEEDDDKEEEEESEDSYTERQLVQSDSATLFECDEEEEDDNKEEEEEPEDSYTERQLVLSAGLFDDQVSLSSSRQGVVWKSGCGVNNPNRKSDVESDSATLFECDDDEEDDDKEEEEESEDSYPDLGFGPPNGSRVKSVDKKNEMEDDVDVANGNADGGSVQEDGVAQMKMFYEGPDEGLSQISTEGEYANEMKRPGSDTGVRGAGGGLTLPIDCSGTLSSLTGDAENERNETPVGVMDFPALKEMPKSINIDSPVSVACGSAIVGGGLIVPSCTNRFGKVPEEIAIGLDSLSTRQLEAVTRIFDGENLFVTGRGGTGKSAIMKLVADLNSQGPHFKVGSLALRTKVIVGCAPTGIAASSMAFPGSSTIYSRLGISTHCKTPEELVRHLKRNPEMLEVWDSLDVLVIDEISMVEADLFDMLVETTSLIRESPTQFVVLGDWLQLPPIQKRSALRLGRNFAFKSRSWPKLFPLENVVQLLVSYRHKNSSVLDLVCQEVRVGRVESSTARLLALHQPDDHLRDEDFTTVTTRKIDAAKVNDQFMRDLGGDIIVFRAKDVCRDFCPQALCSSFMRSCLAEWELKLCVGAKVVLVKNLSIPAGLVNGAQGFVRRFVHVEDCQGLFPVCDFSGVNTTRERASPSTYEIVEGSTTMVVLKPVEFSLTRLNGGFEEKLCTRTAIPVIKSFALTAHKAQSLTIPVLSCNFAGVFEAGQSYAIISRAVSLNTSRFRNFCADKCYVDRDALQYYEELDAYEGRKKEDDERAQARSQRMEASKERALLIRSLKKRGLALEGFVMASELGTGSTHVGNKRRK